MCSLSAVVDGRFQLTHPVREASHGGGGGGVRGQQEAGVGLAGLGPEVPPQGLVAEEGPREQEVSRRRGQPAVERREEVGGRRGEQGGQGERGHELTRAEHVRGTLGGAFNPEGENPESLLKRYEEGKRLLNLPGDGGLEVVVVMVMVVVVDCFVIKQTRV